MPELAFDSSHTVRTNYTVKTIGGCTAIFGPIPISEIHKLVSGFSNTAVIDTDLANLIGATLLFGELADMEKLRERRHELPRSQQRLDEQATPGIPEQVANWLAYGERGLSSEAMCFKLFGVPSIKDARSKTFHPHDPADLRRCMLFVKATGTQNRVHEMRDVSPEWARLVAAWDELIALLKSELDGGIARKTLKRMDEVLKVAA